MTNKKITMNDLFNEITSVKTDVQDLKTDTVSIKTNVSELKNDMMSVKTDVQDLKTDMQDLLEFLQENMILRSEFNQFKLEFSDKIDAKITDLKIGLKTELGGQIRRLSDVLERKQIITKHDRLHALAVS